LQTVKHICTQIHDWQPGEIGNVLPKPLALDRAVK
jgi:hypothetical protein